MGLEDRRQFVVFVLREDQQEAPRPINVLRPSSDCPVATRGNCDGREGPLLRHFCAQNSSKRANSGLRTVTQRALQPKALYVRGTCSSMPCDPFSIFSLVSSMCFKRSVKGLNCDSVIENPQRPDKNRLLVRSCRTMREEVEHIWTEFFRVGPRTPGCRLYDKDSSAPLILRDAWKLLPESTGGHIYRRLCRCRRRRGGRRKRRGTPRG